MTAGVAGQSGVAMPDRAEHEFVNSASAVAAEADAAEAETWIVVNTQTHRERLAVEHLERQHYRPYCPMVRARIRHARRTSEVLRPLFPGYLFVALDPARQRWQPIMSTVGVRTVVRNGDVPGRLDAGLVQSLRAREVDGVITYPQNPYQVGQEVKIAGGPFDGWVGKIMALEARERVIVLLDLLNRPVKTFVNVAQICPS
jgi:transcriptional antiterminator RfaH